MINEIKNSQSNTSKSSSFSDELCCVCDVRTNAAMPFYITISGRLSYSNTMTAKNTNFVVCAFKKDKYFETKRRVVRPRRQWQPSHYMKTDIDALFVSPL